MPQLRHSTIIALSGLLWAAVGASLLLKGVNLLNGVLAPSVVAPAVSTPIVDWLIGYAGSIDNVVVILMALSLSIGYVKGRTAMAKSVRGVVERVRSFPNPTSLANAYNKGFFILIAVMMMIGISMNIFHVSPDVRGCVDTAIGFALLSGALQYFRCALAVRKEQKSL